MSAAVIAIIVSAVAVAGLSIVLLLRIRARRARARLPVAAPVEAPPTPAAPVEAPIVEVAPVEPPAAPVEAPPTPAAPVEAPPLVEAAPEPRRVPSLKERLGRARASFGQALVGILRKSSLSAEDWEDVETILLSADVGVTATMRIVDDLKARSRGTTTDQLQGLLRDELLAILGDPDRSLAVKPAGLTIWLVTGVNGTGKTTTIGKLASSMRNDGKRVVLAAADTFRAAADEQLERWAELAGAEVVKHQPGADPAAVAFDGIKAANARGADVLIVDTAGRLHTKRNLMEELGKIRRVMEREAGPPDEVLLVLDATTGQNGIVQARAFAEAAGVTGVVLTKLDGTAKGGIVIGVQQELGLPVKLVGIGEAVEDLAPFDPRAFVDALIG